MQSVSIDDSNASVLDFNNSTKRTTIDENSSLNKGHIFNHLHGTSKALFDTPMDITPIPTNHTDKRNNKHSSSLLQTLLFDSPSSNTKSDSSPSLTLEDSEEALDESTNRILAGLEDEFDDEAGSPAASSHTVEDQENQTEETEEQEEQLTDSARKRKDEEESERLAWELMRQEQEELYNMQLQFIQSQQGNLSEEDYQALQAILQENTAQMQVMNAVQQGEQEGEGEEGEQAEGEGEGEDGEEGEEDWDYERLLALGQALGDVKTERWRLRAKTVIESLPTATYCEVVKKVSVTSLL
jgi:vacuolar-type H+-ATPase subunit I/STV1